MKTKLIILLGFLNINFMFSQNLNIKFVEQITKISFLDIDELVINGNGFKKLKEENDGKKITYAKIFNHDSNSFIIISAFSSIKTPINVLDITIGKNIDIGKIKNDLVENGYLNTGMNKYDFLIYEKDKLIFLVSNSPNSEGAYQILVTYPE